MRPFWHFVQHHLDLLTLMVMAFYFVWRVKKIALYLFILYTLAVTYMTFRYFGLNFDKILLLLNAAYVMLAFYFNLALHTELNEIIYCPGHGPYHFGRKSPYQFDVTLEWKDGQSKGYLTNWSDSSCFVILENLPPNLPCRIKLAIECEGNRFIQTGEIKSKFLNSAVGIEFYSGNENNELYTWKAFYQIISERGYTPQFIKV
jgi:hypothetical protein